MNSPKMSRTTLVLLFTFFFAELRCENLTYLHLYKSFDTLNLLEGLADFNTTSVCSQQVSELIEDLKTGKSWAQSMFDSSAKAPSGLLKGNVLNLGQYDECLEIEHPTENFTGKHCMISVDAYYRANQSYFNVLKSFLPSETIKQLKLVENLDNIAFGFCVPSTCRASHIGQGINSKLKDSNLDQFLSLYVYENACQTKNSVESKNIGWTAWGPLLFFIAISLLSTIYDVTHQKFLKVKPNPLFSAFSFYSNGKYLFHITKDSEQLKCLHGMRVLSTFWIVTHHHYFFRNLGANRFEAVKLINDVHHIHKHYGFIAVDTFFFMSGMLTTIVFFRDIKKKGYYDAPLGYIHRYIRLTPSYAAMIFLVAQFYGNLGDGPLWHYYATYSTYYADVCKRKWWTGLLYVQNLVNPKEMCLGETWYLSSDMQLHWLSPLILYPVFFWPIYAKFVFGGVLLVAVSTTFGIGYSNNLAPSHLLSTNPGLQGEVDYYPFYTRAAPFIIGLSTGYLINTIKSRKIAIRLSKIHVLAGWLTSTTLCLSSLYCIVLFAKYGTENIFANVLYLSLYRVAWGFGLSWIVFACLNGYGGLVNAFLSWDVFQPFSKLSYNVYLVHFTLILYKWSTLKKMYFGSDGEMTFSLISNLVVAFSLAILLSLMFEIPFANLDKYYLQNIKILPIPRQKKELTDGSHAGMSKKDRNAEEGFQQEMEPKTKP